MLRQYHSNDLEALSEALCVLLQQSPPPPLIPETVVIPNVGMAKWLRQQIAQSLGIAANIRMELATPFFAGIAHQVLDAEHKDSTQLYTREAMAWRLMRLLPEMLSMAEFAPIASYLEGELPQRRRFALTEKIAYLFDQYLLLRPDWLLAWERGERAADCPDSDHPWQPILWRALQKDIALDNPGVIHGAARFSTMLTKLKGEPLAFKERLPHRVFTLGLTALPALFLDVLNALGSTVEVYLLHFNPCREFWGDVVDDRTLARWRLLNPAKAAATEVGHPLLASWGKTGRDYLQLLLGATDGDVWDLFTTPSTETLLGQLQTDVLNLHLPDSPHSYSADDQSLLFVQAHSPLREVEVLHDYLLGLFERVAGLTPRDIVVMAPDVNLYAPYITAVFEEVRGNKRFIPYTIADRSLSENSPLIQSLLHLLRLSESRFTASEVLSLLAVPAVRNRFAIAAQDVVTLRMWIHDSGIRWGLEGAISEELPQLACNTWQFGLERMLLGMSISDNQLFREKLPFAATVGQNAELVGQLIEFVEELRRCAKLLSGSRPISQWLQLLNDVIGAFYDADADTEGELAEVRSVLGDIAVELDSANFGEALTRDVMLKILESRLEEAAVSRQFLTGSVNVSLLTPLRSMPFRVICLLGMNADAYPRTTAPLAFDLVSLQPRLGDRTRREDDRYLFLETVLSAKDHLYISCIGRDERSNAKREPSVVVSELREHLDRYWLPAKPPSDDNGELKSTSELLTRYHLLKPFHSRYFSGADDLFSYRHEWLPIMARKTAPAFLSQPLPPPEEAPIQWASLKRFFRNPCQAFFNDRLGVFFEEATIVADDYEPLALDALANYQLKEAFVRATISQVDDEVVVQRQLASGAIPLGYAGRMTVNRAVQSVQDLRERLAAVGTGELQSYPLDLNVASGRIMGTLSGLRAGAVLELRPGLSNGATFLKFWMAHLAGCAQGVLTRTSVLLDERKSWHVPSLEVSEAKQHLADMLDVYREGQTRPLPLFPKSAWAYIQALQDDKPQDEAILKARTTFMPSFWVTGEGENHYVARVFPTVDAALNEEFMVLAEKLFNPLLEHLRAGLPDAAT